MTNNTTRITIELPVFCELARSMHPHTVSLKVQEIIRIIEEVLGEEPYSLTNSRELIMRCKKAMKDQRDDRTREGITIDVTDHMIDKYVDLVSSIIDHYSDGAAQFKAETIAALVFEDAYGVEVKIEPDNRDDGNGNGCGCILRRRRSKKNE